MLASIPEDCLLGILDVARVQDIINLRQTCKELYRITRLRTLWLAIYARLECDQNILLPPIPTPYTLSTLPLSHLETLCVSALKLHNTWTSPSYSPSPTPARLSSVVPKFEYYSGFLSDTPEPVKTTSLSPGGRFLIVFTADFSMHVVDLNTSVGHLAVTGRTLRNGYLETAGRNNAGVGGRRDVQAGFIFHEMTANIVWHNDVKASVCLQAAGAINQYPHLVCAHQEWIIEIVGRDDPEIPNAIISRAFPQTSSTNTGQPKQFATCTLRTFFPTKYSLNPRIVDASAAPLMSAYAHGIRQIHVHDCESGKGVVLCGDGPKELDHKSPVSRHYTETRIFQTDGDTYVGCVDGALTVHVYSVPRLQDQRDQQFSRVEAVPVAKDKLESACEALHIGSWHRSDSTETETTFYWHILTPNALFRLTFNPRMLELSKTKTELSIRVPYAALFGQRHRHWGHMGDVRGTRGVLVEGLDEDNSHQRLMLVSPEGSPSEAVGGVADAGRFVDTYLDKPNIALDEYTGRICFSRRRVVGGDGQVVRPEFLVVDFADRRLLDLY